MNYPPSLKLPDATLTDQKGGVLKITMTYDKEPRMYGGFGWLYFHVFLFISIYLFNFWFETPPPHVRFKWMTQNQVRG